VRRRELECVIAADPAGAIEASAAAFDAWVELFSRPRPRRAHSEAARASRAELVARRITETLHPGKEPKPSNVLATRIGLHILREQLQPGEPVAPEPELMKMFGVGRHVLREAIRVLQRDDVVETGVGRHGGLRVGAPDVHAVVNRTVDYLRRLDVSEEDMQLLAVEMLILAADIAASRVSETPRAVPLHKVDDHLRALSETRGEDATGWLYGLGGVLAELGGNPILRLFFSVVLDFHAAGKSTPISDPAVMAAAGRKFLEALQSGDARLSRRALTQLVNSAGL
jgi:DNA-binding FadR family transcriptional regulator